ncbi:MAG: alpha/beta hydrolase [Holophagaceae bacterium]|nr:alpha/beta hydrolase [Holophagaceae bacterium]
MMLSPEPQPTSVARPQSGWLRRWTKRIGIGVIGLLVALIAGGESYQLLGQHRDASMYPAPGRLVDVSGSRLHLYSSGTGAIPVVLVAANGGGVLDWYKVQPQLAKFTQVVSYDRAGTGWSEVSAEPRSSARIVQELHTLLAKAGIKSPYVLVGHSLGGFHMQLYAMRYPEEVAGLVLVDSSHADMATRKEFVPKAFTMPTLVRLVGSLGVVRLLNGMNDRANLRTPSEAGPGFVPELEHESSMIYSHTGTLVAMAREFSALPESAAQVRAANLQLGDKPLFVLTRSGEPNPSPERRAIETIWMAWQADLANRSHNVKHVVAEHSGHFIHQDQPDLVVTAIKQTVLAARDKTKLR